MKNHDELVDWMAEATRRTWNHRKEDREGWQPMLHFVREEDWAPDEIEIVHGEATPAMKEQLAIRARATSLKLNCVAVGFASRADMIDEAGGRQDCLLLVVDSRWGISGVLWKTINAKLDLGKKEVTQLGRVQETRLGQLLHPSLKESPNGTR